MIQCHMLRYLYILFLFCLPISAKIYEIPPKLLHDMITNSSHKTSCPIQHNDLRVVEVLYINFYNQTQTGKIIVHRIIAKNIEKIF